MHNREIMKKNFTQPIEKSPEITVSLLIEAERDEFLLFTSEDELGAYYACPLTVTMRHDEDITLQLAKTLHENGLELVKYRELLRETCVNYSYLDDKAGDSRDVVIFHVTAERTNRAVPHASDQTVEFVTIEEYMHNLRATGIPAGLLEASASHLFLERSLYEEIR